MFLSLILLTESRHHVLHGFKMIDHSRVGSTGDGRHWWWNSAFIKGLSACEDAGEKASLEYS